MTEYICTKCSYVGKRKKMRPGSTAIEVLLWAVLLIPGPFYSLWRVLARKWACPQCGETKMVPVRSDKGKEKIADVERDIAPEALAKIPDIWEKDREEYAKIHPEEHVVVKKYEDKKDGQW